MLLRLLLAPLCLSLLLASLVAPLGAEESADDGRPPEDVEALLPWAAHFEPADLGPGQSGVLVVSTALTDDRLHVEGPNLMWAPLEVAGITYDVEQAAIDPAPRTFEDEWGDTKQWHEGKFAIRVPIAVAADASPDAAPGLDIKYSVCSHSSCSTLKKVKVRLPLPVVAEPGGGDTASEPAAPILPAPHSASYATVSVRLEHAPDRVVVRFVPDFGTHIYLPPRGESGLPIAVNPKESEGITWGRFEIPEGGEQHEPIEIDVPFTRADGARELRVEVFWLGCEDMGQCGSPTRETFVIGLPGVEPSPAPTGALVEDEARVETPVGEAIFPVITTDKAPGGKSAQGNIARRIRESGLLLTLLGVFLVGAALTFTPCVFPIIPLVVASIAGGKEVPKRRLTALLLTYVVGMCLTFATTGLIAALGGGSMSAAFESPWFLWAMSIFFVVLSFGMVGLFELQPPQWLMKLQGSAQGRGGSLVGAFLLGVLGAVLASPCTGPVIVGMLAFTAQTGDAVLGFLLFFVFGLGMGMVFFAFGSLNFALRPGPWMVWVRYIFGVLLFGGAAWYIASSELVSRPMLWIGGVGVAVLLGVLLRHHLIHKQMEAAPKARKHSLIVAGLYVLALLVVGFLTRPVDGLPWKKIYTVAELRAEVAAATAAGRPVVIDTWATWCTKCKDYDRVFANDDDLQAKLARVVRLKLDVTHQPPEEDLVRDAALIKRGQQPYLVFIDGKGNIRQGLNGGWFDGNGGDDENVANNIRIRLAIILGETQGETVAIADPEAS